MQWEETKKLEVERIFFCQRFGMKYRPFDGNTDFI